MIRTIIQLPEEVHQQLREKSYQEKISISAICREAIEKKLKEAPTMKQVTSKTLEIIEELGNIPVATIEDLENYIAELKEFGFTAYPDNNIDNLLDVLTRLLLEVRNNKKRNTPQKEDTPMKLTEWQEKMHEEVEGTVHISKIMDVPHHQDTVRYQVYNEEGTFDKLFDVTFNEEDEITNID